MRDFAATLERSVNDIHAYILSLAYLGMLQIVLDPLTELPAKEGLTQIIWPCSK